MVETKSLTRDVKEILLDWIRQGKYPPGSQLPSVQELVDRLEVSRTVVREALQALVGMNFVQIRPGLGCFRMVAHSAGVKIKATSTDSTIDDTMVTENCR